MSKEFGVLPYPGSLVEQPTDVIERFEVILKVRSDLDNESLEKAKQQPPDA